MIGIIVPVGYNYLRIQIKKHSCVILRYHISRSIHWIFYTLEKNIYYHRANQTVMTV